MLLDLLTKNVVLFIRFYIFTCPKPLCDSVIQEVGDFQIVTEFHVTLTFYYYWKYHAKTNCCIVRLTIVKTGIFAFQSMDRFTVINAIS